MQVIDQPLLAEFRLVSRCQWCQQPTPGCEPHHAIIRRGIGGGSRLDVAINLVALCHTCHARVHNEGTPTREQLLSVISDREGLAGEEILGQLWAMVRESKPYLPF